jgi:hypothetical protein
MRRRIHVWHMRRRIHVPVLNSYLLHETAIGRHHCMAYEEEDTCARA